MLTRLFDYLDRIFSGILNLFLGIKCRFLDECIVLGTRDVWANCSFFTMILSLLVTFILYFNFFWCWIIMLGHFLLPIFSLVLFLAISLLSLSICFYAFLGVPEYSSRGFFQFSFLLTKVLCWTSGFLFALGRGRIPLESLSQFSILRYLLWIILGFSSVILFFAVGPLPGGVFFSMEFYLILGYQEKILDFFEKVNLKIFAQPSFWKPCLFFLDFIHRVLFPFFWFLTSLVGVYYYHDLIFLVWGMVFLLPASFSEHVHFSWQFYSENKLQALLRILIVEYPGGQKENTWILSGVTNFQLSDLGIAQGLKPDVLIWSCFQKIGRHWLLLSVFIQADFGFSGNISFLFYVFFSGPLLLLFHNIIPMKFLS